MSKVMSVKCGGNKPNSGWLGRRPIIPLSEQLIGTVVCHGPNIFAIYNALKTHKQIKVKAGDDDIIAYAGRYIKARGIKGKGTGSTKMHDPHSFSGKFGRIGILASAGLCTLLMPIMTKNHYFVAFTRTPKKEFVKDQKWYKQVLSISKETTLNRIADATAAAMGLDIVTGKTHASTINGGDVFDAVTGAVQGL